ncbi:MAG: right-handed parallel beta-helix repeat-containing protein [Armatimonadetes bacterium]|nr:right-handed parallel beta-helix repeat-containing protein [Armatimonadota bacterium]
MDAGSGGTLTVGPANADVIGSDGMAIQGAILLAAHLGIRRVLIRKGTYRCHNTLILHAGLTLEGEGEETVLQKPPYVESAILQDVSHYEQGLVVQDPELFPVGCAIRLHGVEPGTQAPTSSLATVMARDGNRLSVAGKRVGGNFWLSQGPAKVSTIVPLVRGDQADGVVIRSLQLAGHAEREGLSYRGGHGLYLNRCHHAVIENVYSHHHDGDGIGFETSYHVRVEGCRMEANAMACHAGSGALHFLVRDNRLTDNHLGFYFCWGVQHSLLEGNEIIGGDSYGVSVGFHDSYNTIRGNRIVGNRGVGISLRRSRHPDQSPRDVLIERNVVEDNGSAEKPLAVRIEDAATGIRLVGNTFRETRSPGKGAAVVIESTVGTVSLEGNRVEGFEAEVEDRREPR